MIDGIDKQIAESEAELMGSLPAKEPRKLAERLANLKVARHRLELVLQNDPQHTDDLKK